MTPNYSSFVGLRLTRTERSILERLAAEAGLSLSSYIRETIIAQAVRPLWAPAGQDHDDAA